MSFDEIDAVFTDFCTLDGCTERLIHWLRECVPTVSLCMTLLRIFLCTYIRSLNDFNYK